MREIRKTQTQIHKHTHTHTHTHTHRGWGGRERKKFTDKCNRDKCTIQTICTTENPEGKSHRQESSEKALQLRPSSYRARTVVLNHGRWCPQRTFGNIWKHF